VSEIEDYKDQFDNGVEVDLNECKNVHTVAGLLKLWLREMPEPILTFELYVQLLLCRADRSILAMIALWLHTGK
jgi:hypothetical protein